MSLIDNERAKLTANWLNTLSAGTIIAGCVTPLVAIAYGLRPGAEPLDRAFIFAVLLLDFDWCCLTSSREDDPRKAHGMTLLEAYALFGIPAILLVIGFGSLFLTRPRKHPHPGE